jgi:hypothetical protein
MITEHALQRLQASRASIEAELRKLDGRDDDDAHAARASASAASGVSPPLFDGVWRGLRLWWRRHPARPVLDIASDAGTQALRPLVRTHPVASLSIAMAAGAAMVVWRPWRSRVSAAVWAGLGAQLTSGLVRSVLNPGTLSALLGSLPRSPPQPPVPVTDASPSTPTSPPPP